jgi:hypothetical protein
MNPLTCPRCGHIDQVQSAATVYAVGSGVQHGVTTGLSGGLAVGAFGVAPVVMGHRSYTVGTQASQLALSVAPPPVPQRPRRMPSAGEVVLLVLLGVPALIMLVVAVTAPNAPSIGARAVAVLFCLMLLAVPVTVLAFGERRRSRRRTNHRAYRRVWPTAIRAWQEAMVCLRCHIAFFPAAAAAGMPAARDAVPLPGFGAAVLAVGMQVTEWAEAGNRSPAIDSIEVSASPVVSKPTEAIEQAGHSPDHTQQSPPPTPPD